MVNGMKQVLERLDVIKSELDYIKEHMADTTLTQEDVESLNEAEKELKEGKTKRLI